MAHYRPKLTIDDHTDGAVDPDIYSRGCRGKIRYSSKGRARGSMRLMKQHGARHTDWLEPYKCKVCRYWHLGNRPRSMRT